MERLYLLVLAACAVATGYTMVKPTPAIVAVGARLLLLPLVSALIAEAFTASNSDDTIVQLFIAGATIGWIATLRPVLILYPTNSGTLTLRAESIEQESFITASFAAAILVIMTLLHTSSIHAHATQSHGDIGALWGFATCFAAWIVIIASMTLPGRFIRAGRPQSSC